MLKWLFGLWLVVSAPFLGAQTFEGYPRVVVEDSARRVLSNDWDSHASNPYATERVYCARVQVMSHKVTGQYLYMINRVRRIAAKDSTAYSARFANCETNEVFIHTHNPSTCDLLGNCLTGGYDAFDCEPSALDYKTIFTLSQAFAGVQCDRGAVRWFYNAEHSLNKKRKG